jgi:hypothetical protein
VLAASWNSVVPCCFSYLLNSCRLEKLPELAYSSVLQKAGRDVRQVSSDWKQLYGPLTCGLRVDYGNSSPDDLDHLLAHDPDRFKDIYSLVLDQALPKSPISQSFPQLVSLSLGQLSIDDARQDAFASFSALSALTALQALTVRSEFLGPDVVDVVLEAMVARGQGQTLTRLDLGGGYQCYDDDFSEQGLQSLRALASGLQSVRLGHAAADFSSFCNALGSLTRLTQLSVHTGYRGVDEAVWVESSDKLSGLTDLVDLHISEYDGVFMRAALRMLPRLTNICRLHLELELGGPEDFDSVDGDFHHIGSLHRTLTSLRFTLVSGHSLAGFIGQLTELQHLDLSDAQLLVEEPAFVPRCLRLLPPSLRSLVLPWQTRNDVPAYVLAALKAAADAAAGAFRIEFLQAGYVADGPDGEASSDGDGAASSDEGGEGSSDWDGTASSDGDGEGSSDGDGDH